MEKLFNFRLVGARALSVCVVVVLVQLIARNLSRLPCFGSKVREGFSTSTPLSLLVLLINYIIIKSRR
jgi:hypothetical protein